MNVASVEQQGLVLAPLDCFSRSKQISHLHLCRHDAVRVTGQRTLCELCRPDCAGNGLKGVREGEGWRIFKALSISNVGSECKAQMFSAFPMSTGVGEWKQTEERNIGGSSPVRKHLQQGGVGVYGVRGYSSASLRSTGQAWSWEDPGSLTEGC